MDVTTIPETQENCTTITETPEPQPETQDPPQLDKCSSPECIIISSDDDDGFVTVTRRKRGRGARKISTTSLESGGEGTICLITITYHNISTYPHTLHYCTLLFIFIFRTS